FWNPCALRMGLISRAGAAAALFTASDGVVPGWGGSTVADANAPDPTRRAPAPQSPFCAAAQANLEAIRPLNGLVARGQVAPEELERSVAAVRRSGQGMVHPAPNEIRTDVGRTVPAPALPPD